MSRHGPYLPHYDFDSYPAKPYFSCYPTCAGTLKQLCFHNMHKSHHSDLKKKKKDGIFFTSMPGFPLPPFKYFPLTREFKQKSVPQFTFHPTRIPSVKSVSVVLHSASPEVSTSRQTEFWPLGIKTYYFWDTLMLCQSCIHTITFTITLSVLLVQEKWLERGSWSVSFFSHILQVSCLEQHTSH